MSAQAPKLDAAENDLKRLMADVSRAMEKPEQAVARMASRVRNCHDAGGRKLVPLKHLVMNEYGDLFRRPLAVATRCH